MFTKVEAYECRKCGQVDVPLLSEEQKSEMAKLYRESPLRAIQFLVQHSEFNLVQSKSFVKHINKKTGHCHVCKVKDIVGENKNCPNCGRFSVNWDLERLEQL